MTKWNDSLVFTIYDLVKDGATLNTVAKTIGVTKPTLITWRKKYKKIRMAIKTAKSIRKKTNNNLSIKDYVYNRLPDNLKSVWEKINQYDKEGTDTGKIESLLANKGKAANQYLFIYALISNNFSIAKACRKVGISRGLYYQWLNNDGDFGKLVKEIEDIKKDFIESQFYKLVKAMDTTAILYGLKTKCKDRGYGEKIEIDKNTTIKGRIVIDELPMDVREKILETIRRRAIDSTVIDNIPSPNPVALLPDKIDNEGGAGNE